MCEEVVRAYEASHLPLRTPEQEVMRGEQGFDLVIYVLLIDLHELFLQFYLASCS